MKLPKLEQLIREKQIIKFFLIGILIVNFSCLNQDHNESNRDILNEKINNLNFRDRIKKRKLNQYTRFLKEKNKPDLEIEDLLEYSKIYEGLKYCSNQVCELLLGGNLNFDPSFEMYLNFIEERENYFLTSFQYTDTIIARQIYTINSKENFEYIDQIIINKDFMNKGQIFRITNAGMSIDTLIVDHLFPFNLNMNNFKNRHQIQEKFLLTDKGFRKLLE